MARFIVCIGVTVALTAAAATAGADTVTLGAVKDNTLFDTPSGELSNGAGQHLFAGETSTGTGGQHRRGLIAFDVTSIPPGSTITAVRLTLHMSRTVSGPQNVRAHRVLADWGQGTSAAGRGEGGGAAPTPNDATWIHRFFNGATWTTPGGDFVATASSTTSLNQVADYTWSSAGMVADVQAWIDGTASNFGWILVGNEVSIATAKRFDSRENTTVAFPPRLAIDFIGSPVEAHTWSTVKSLYR